MNQRHLRGAAVAVTAAAFVSLAVVVPASADNGTDTSALRQAVTVEGILAHEEALQAIADANGDTRASGTPGYEASGAYVEELLEEAGYLVSRQSFTYEQFILELQRHAADGAHSHRVRRGRAVRSDGLFGIRRRDRSRPGRRHQPRR